MFGSIRWNLCIGFIGFIGTFLASWQHNVFSTALLRSLYSGITLFSIAFVMRWIFGILIRLGTPETSGNAMESEPGYKGGQIDLTTPAGEDESGQYRNSAGKPDEVEQAFTPLQPPRLASTSDIEPQELVNALRRMSEE